MSKLQLISGRSHPQLAQKISQLLKLGLTPVEIKNFANTETYVRIKEKVRGDDIFLIQSLPAPVNEHLMELLVTIDALKRASAGRINVVCPWLAYSRQDRKATSREPITAKLVANLITKAGASRLLTVDLHSDQIQGFFDIPVDHLAGYPLFAQYFLKKKKKDQPLVVVSPDVGGVKRGRRLAALLDSPLAIVDKRRPTHNQAEVLNLIGEVSGKTALVIDDIVDTGGTVAEVADVLAERGALKVIICASHGLLSGEAGVKLEKCAASQVFLLDSVPLPKEKKLSKIKILSLAPFLAKMIQRIHQRRSLGALFTWEKK